MIPPPTRLYSKKNHRLLSKLIYRICIVKCFAKSCDKHDPWFGDQDQVYSEIDAVKGKWGEEHRTGEQGAFDRMREMQTPQFARREAEEPTRSLRSRPDSVS